MRMFTIFCTCLPDSGLSELLTRSIFRSGENQRSLVVVMGLSFPIVPGGIVLEKRVPVTVKPSMVVVPRSSEERSLLCTACPWAGIPPADAPSPVPVTGLFATPASECDMSFPVWLIVAVLCSRSKTMKRPSTRSMIKT